MYRDPIVEEIHRIREEHAKKFDYDPRAIYLDIKRREKEARKRGIKFVTLKPRGTKPAKAVVRARAARTTSVQ